MFKQIKNVIVFVVLLMVAALGLSASVSADTNTPFSKLPKAIQYDIKTGLSDTWDVKKGKFAVRVIDLNKDGIPEI